MKSKPHTLSRYSLEELAHAKVKCTTCKKKLVRMELREVPVITDGGFWIYWFKERPFHFECVPSEDKP